jgi:hypothetical protein
MNIKSIIIVGGGSSGWCTAAALAKHCPNIEIKLIESGEIPTVGVGESTIAYFNFFMHELGLQNSDWMPYCDAVYKNSIKFSNIRKEGSGYHVPFTNYTGSEERLARWNTISEQDTEFSADNFSRHFYDGVYLSEHNKLTYNTDNLIEDYSLEYNASYNLDATKFSNYLKHQYCIPRGVVCINDTIVGLGKDGNNNITFLEGNNNNYYSADLYIDCTGFKSMLLERHMGSTHIPYDQLINNRAVVVNNIEYEDKEKEMENFTDTIGKENGWLWNIPLWNRISNGYVFSTKIMDDETAKRKLIDHIREVRGDRRANQAKPFFVNIRNGRHDKAWVNNVVGLGLSYGFIEPLGSTGLLITQRGIMELVSRLNSDIKDIEYHKNTFNNFMSEFLDYYKDFYLVHFVFTEREDTDFWRHCKYNINPTGMPFNTIENTKLTTSENLGWIWAYYGMGCKMLYMGKDFNIEEEKNKYLTKEKNLKLKVEELPSTFEFMKNNIYNKVLDL